METTGHTARKTNRQLKLIRVHLEIMYAEGMIGSIHFKLVFKKKTTKNNTETKKCIWFLHALNVYLLLHRRFTTAYYPQYFTDLFAQYHNKWQTTVKSKLFFPAPRKPEF